MGVQGGVLDSTWDFLFWRLVVCSCVFGVLAVFVASCFSSFFFVFWTFMLMFLVCFRVVFLTSCFYAFRFFVVFGFQGSRILKKLAAKSHFQPF